METQEPPAKQLIKQPIKQYNFEQQKKLGLQGESLLDSYFSRWYFIRGVPYELQKEGVDRFFIPKRGEIGFPRLVEYKTDYQDTGNAFVETHSVIRVGQERDIQGWLHTSKSDWLIYFFAVYETALVLSFPILRESVIAWEAKKLCRRRDCINTNYKGSGLIVPLQLMLRASHAVFKISYSAKA